MPVLGDPYGLPPVPLDMAPDLASLAWPWDQAMPVVAPTAPATPPDATPQAAAVPAPETSAPPPPADASVPVAGAPAPEHATVPVQPGLGIPQATLDALILPHLASPPPQAAPPIAAPAPDAGPIVAAPAAGQPLTPAAGSPAPIEPLSPAPDLASFAPAPLGEPGLPPAPSPLSPAPALLPSAIEPVTGMLEPAGLPSETTLAGLAGAPPTPEQRYATLASEYQRNPGKLLDRLEQPGALDADTQRYLDEFAQRDPAGAAVLRQRLADVGTTKLAEARARVAKEDFDRQKANLDMRNKALAEATRKSAQIEADSEAMAKTKIGYHPSTFQRIAGVIAAVVGGLYQGRTGSARNPGLDALNDVINRDLEEQKLNLANKRDVLQQRRSALGELIARTNDTYQANETMRLAALKYADEQLAQQQLNFAPDGTRGLNLAAMRTGLNAQIAANKEARDQKLLESSLKVQNAAREQQLANETLRHNRASEGVEYAKLSLERGKAKADATLLTPAQIRQQFPDFPVTAIPPGGATIADLSKRAELYGKGQEANAKGRENLVNEAATVVRNPVTKQPIVDTTGQPARMRAEDATKFTGEIGKQQQFMDQMADIRRDLETDPSTWDRDKWASVVSKYERAKVKFIGSADAKPSSREMQAVEEMFGTNFDGFVSRIKDRGTATARIDALMDGTQSDALTDANLKLGYDGPPILRDPRKFATHANTPEEQATLDSITRLKEKPNVSYGTAMDQAVHYHLEGLKNPTTGQVDTEVAKSALAAARQEAEQYKDISPQQRRDLQALAFRAMNGDEKAAATLQDLAKPQAKGGAHSKVVRDLAQEAYDKAREVAGQRTARDVFGEPPPAVGPLPTYDTPDAPPWHPVPIAPTFPGGQ